MDETDIFLGKLFSPREKDRDDLRELFAALDRAALARRLHATCASFLADPTLRGHADRNWYILTGEPLP